MGFIITPPATVPAAIKKVDDKLHNIENFWTSCGLPIEPELLVVEFIEWRYFIHLMLTKGFVYMTQVYDASFWSSYVMYVYINQIFFNINWA